MEKKIRANILDERPIIEFPTIVKICLIMLSFMIGLSVLFLPPLISIMLVVGISISIAIFFNLYIGLLIFLIGAFFHPTYWLPQLQAFHPARLLAIGVVFIWAFHILIYRDFKFVKVPQNYIFLLFLCIAFISTFFSPYFDYTFSYFIEFGVKAFVLYFLIINLVKSQKQVVFFSYFLIIIGFLLSLIGIYQYINHIGVVYKDEGILRIAGLAEDPNLFAMDLITIIPIAFAMFFSNRAIFIKIMISFVIILLIVTTVLTYSRAGFLQLSIVLFLAVGVRMYKRNKILTVATFLIIIMIALPLVPGKYWERIQTMTNFDDPAIGKRLSGWQVGLQMFSENPIKGVGLGLFRYEFFEHALASPDVRYKQPLDAHNTYIHTAAEMGTFGLLFLIYLIYLTFRDISITKKISHSSGNKFMWEISNGIEISLVSYLIGGMFISYLHLLIFWIIVPMAIAMKQLSFKLSQGQK
jgi:O-antigen ligase